MDSPPRGHDGPWLEPRLVDLLFDSATDGIALADSHYRITRVNPTLAAWFGGDEALLGRRCFTALTAQEAPCPHCPLGEEDPSRHEACVVPLNGGGQAPQWLELRAMPLRDGGELKRVLIQARDVTDAWASREALRRSEAAYREIIEECPLGFFQSTLDGRFLRLNQALAEMLGYEDPEEVMREVTDIGTQLFLRPERRREIIAHGLEKGVTTLDIVYRRRGGEVWVGQATMRLVKDRQGNPLYLEGMLEDVTARRRAQERLAASEERYRTMVETANEGIWAADAEQRTTYVNRHTAAMLGYSVEEMLGRPVADFLFPQDRPQFAAMIQSLRQRGAYTTERLLRTKSGRGRWVMVSVRAISDAQGRFSGSFAMMSDISELKLALKEREQAIARLESALAKVHHLETLLPICAGCKKIRDDQGYWRTVELYLREHAGIQFSHGLCPDCRARMYPELEGPE